MIIQKFIPQNLINEKGILEETKNSYVQRTELWVTQCVYEYMAGKPVEMSPDYNQSIDPNELLDGIITINEYHCREMIMVARAKGFMIRSKDHMGGLTWTPDDLEEHNKKGAYLWRWYCFDFLQRLTTD